jgi:cytochrome c oxidase cbb3-type subunit 3
MTCGGLDPAHKEAGRKVYNARCYFCHGYKGNANTVAARYLNPRPRDFTQAVNLGSDHIRSAIMNGRTKTAMQGFGKILSPAEIDAVAAFIEEEFIRCQRKNTRYHTATNGWPDHEARNSAAFPFVLGTLRVDAIPDQLTPEERNGKAIFLASCIVCHDGTSGSDKIDEHNDDEDYAEGEAYEYAHVYDSAEETAHDQAPVLVEMTPQVALGAHLYQQNCAMCHAADGTGENWIGHFLQPHPPDFTQPDAATRFDEARLYQVIIAGLPSTSMPAFNAVLTHDQVTAIMAYMKRAFFR